MVNGFNGCVGAEGLNAMRGLCQCHLERSEGSLYFFVLRIVDKLRYVNDLFLPVAPLAMQIRNCGT